MIRALSRSDTKIPFDLAFKGIFGFAFLAVIIVGSVFYFINKDFTLAPQIIAGLVGACAGAFSAWRARKLFSKH
jgi:hypothetical protein